MAKLVVLTAIAEKDLENITDYLADYRRKTEHFLLSRKMHHTIARFVTGVNSKPGYFAKALFKNISVF